jgi:TonB family protein
MIADAALENLAVYSLQIAAIVMIASGLPRLLRLDNAGVRYAYWRAIAVLCLALPWIQPYRQVAPTRSAASVATAVVDVAAISNGSPGAAARIDWLWLGVALVALGAIVRLAWLGLGLWKLQRLRASASAETSGLDDDLQRTLGTRAEIRFASAVNQPVTFGLRRPVVLLPETLHQRSADIRRAVVGHELVHVRRRDWTWLVVEEVVVSLFWFHPAVWWVVSRIQLAREEVVDEVAILLTGRRKSYIEALLAFADSTSVLPIAAFARRRHLFRRIALVSKEDVMSSRRIVASCAAMALVVIAGSWYTVSAFPLRGPALAFEQRTGPGPLEQRAHVVTPENPIPRRLHSEDPVMPDIAGVTGGTMIVKLTIDELGRIAEARVTEISIKGAAVNVGMNGDDIRAQVERMASSLPPDSAAAIRQAAPAFIDAALASVRQWRYDAPAEGPLTFGVPVRIGAAPEIMTFVSRDNALRVGGAIKAPQKVLDVRPVYPPVALEARVAGVVIVEARIGTDGGVEEAHVLRSIPLLDGAALDAVKQWRFTPTLLNGQPTPVMMTLTVNFTLADKQ